ncbi:hypothetical protein BIV57_22055 [Mangrovactinospora gilvigrisea]|uniref:Integral membrane bound transporter domain-containing protein n=1 Tax=Mangrovactinospora gilvigrisea TaxID=1428644 RepID=A0A1J7B9P7_9ACTN|nr:FUSC family protein [Mangrovactinospora gilvigrisea]OIV35334.1 hypothetical protein BIV57_22055 [Mangrovactinospora gilvigrisea]
MSGSQDPRPSPDDAGATATPRRLADLAPPAWLMELVRSKDAGIPWLLMARAALALPAGLAVGILTGHPAQGSAATLGAMAATMADRTGPLRTRLARMLFGFLGGAIGMTVGHAMGPVTPWSIVVFGVLAVVGALASSVNALGSLFGLQLIVQTAIASGRPLPLPTWEVPAWAAAGAAWAIVLGLVTIVLQGVRTPQREAVANVYEQVADLLGSVGSGDRSILVEERQRLTDTLNTAYDTLIGARQRTAGRSREGHQLVGLLNATGPLLDAVVAVVHTERPAPEGYQQCTRLIAEAIRADGRAPRLPEKEASGSDEEWPQEDRLTVRQLRSALGAVLDQLGSDDPETRAGSPARAPFSLRDRVTSTVDQVLTGPQTWLYVLRLTLCITVAETLRTVTHLERSYWMLLTVAIVMKPDFGSVFVRAVQRGLGTVVGVLIGGGILAAHPPEGAIVGLMALFAALFPAAQVRNYGMFTTLLTPFALLLVDSAAPAGADIVEARLLDTLLGCGICLILGYLAWPETWRPLVGRQLAQAMDSVAAYLRVALDPEAPRQRIGQARRRAYRRLSDVRTALQRTVAEPPALARATTAWWPLLSQLERLTDAIAYTVSQVRGLKEVPDPGEVRRLADAADDLAEALHEHRPPRASMLPADTGQLRIIGRAVPPGPDPREDPLEPVARELRTARRLASGPARRD